MPWGDLALLGLRALLAPNRCAACDTKLGLRRVFCDACVVAVERSPRVDPVHIAPFAYGGAIAHAVTRFKYGRRPDLARPLAALVEPACAWSPPATRPWIVPVPLHPRRLLERGYNQAALLAARLAPALGGELAPRALQRIRDTAAQASLGQISRDR